MYPSRHRGSVVRMSEIEATVSVVIKARAAARGLITQVEFVPTWQTTFIEGWKWRYRDANDWVFSLLGQGARDFELQLTPLPFYDTSGCRTEAWSGIGREQSWIGVQMAEETCYWSGTVWVEKAPAVTWHIQFAPTAGIPPLRPPMRIDEVEAALDASLTSCSDFARRQDSQWWWQGFEACRAALTEAATRPTRIEQSIAPLELSRTGSRLAWCLEHLPPLVNMGGWLDHVFGDHDGFGACTTLLADAIMVTYGAIANSTFENDPLIGDDARTKLLFAFLESARHR